VNTTETRRAEAARRLSALQSKLQSARARIKEQRAKLGAEFRDVADGGDMPTSAQSGLAELVAERMTLAAMEAAATRAHRDAEQVAFARGIVLNRDAMQASMREYDAAVLDAEAKADAFVHSLNSVRDAADAIHSNLRALRGRNQMTAHGEVLAAQGAHAVADASGTMENPAGLQWFVNQHFAAVTRWWRAPRAMQFSRTCGGAMAALRSSFDELMGLHDLDPAALKQARLDIAADGAVPTPLSPLPEEEHGAEARGAAALEAFVRDTTDFDDSPAAGGKA